MLMQNEKCKMKNVHGFIHFTFLLFHF